MNRRMFILVCAFTIGLLITLISGLVDTTPAGIMGATWHGWPLAWLYVIVYPGSPWSIDSLNLGGDLLLWFIVSIAGLWGLLALRHKRRK